MAKAREAKFESERQSAFCEDILSGIGGERLRHCIQCGNCSAVCPVSSQMDMTPRRLINLTREGFKDEVLRSHAIWLCTSCYACTYHCPKKIKVTEIMYALKRRAIGEGTYPAFLPIPALAREFKNMLQTRGRMSESWLVTRVFLKTAPWRLLGMTKLGLKLLGTGRLSVGFESMNRPRDFSDYLEAVKKAETDSK